jgi:hypothetical protein
MADETDLDVTPVFVPVAELARQYKVHRQTMGERVGRLAEKHAGLVRKQGRQKLVDAALFATLVDQHGDAVKEAARETRILLDGDDEPAPLRPADNRFRDAQTQRAFIDARIKAIELARLQGALVPVDGAHGVVPAMQDVAAKVRQRLDLIPRWAQDLADEGIVTDEAAARRILRAKTDLLLKEIARAMRDLSLKGGTSPVNFESDLDEILQ